MGSSGLPNASHSFPAWDFGVSYFGLERGWKESCWDCCEEEDGEEEVEVSGSRVSPAMVAVCVSHCYVYSYVSEGREGTIRALSSSAARRENDNAARFLVVDTLDLIWLVSVQGPIDALSG